MNLFIAIVNSFALLIIGLSMGYFLLAMGSGFSVLRREGISLSVQSATRYDKPFEGEPGSFFTYFLIPCLNESAVIGPTVRALRDGAASTAIVIDDGSDDDTGAIARREGGPAVQVLRRSPPHARQGKGEALNHAFGLVRELVRQRGQDSARVLVCVMDADGRLSDGALAHVLPLFDDPVVGGAQLAVRIRNRDVNFLTRFQDFQFWAMSALTQFGRRRTGTVSLGGNGQFTRLSALEQLGHSPWSASLTEDLDLAISLLTRGWVLETTPSASVDQQAVEGLRKLIVQRRRWYQGHMMAGRRIKDVWNEPRLSHVRALEISAYLSVPWLMDLPWSILWHWTLAGFILNFSSVFSYAHGWRAVVLGGTLWYLLTFAPAIMTTVIYVRRDRENALWRSFLVAHSFLVMNYLSFICSWGALYRIVRRQGGWDKTTRSVEAAHVEGQAERTEPDPTRPLDLTAC